MDDEPGPTLPYVVFARHDAPSVEAGPVATLAKLALLDVQRGLGVTIAGLPTLIASAQQLEDDAL